MLITKPEKQVNDLSSQLGYECLQVQQILGYPEGRVIRRKEVFIKTVLEISGIVIFASWLNVTFQFPPAKHPKKSICCIYNLVSPFFDLTAHSEVHSILPNGIWENCQVVVFFFYLKDLPFH